MPTGSSSASQPYPDRKMPIMNWANDLGRHYLAVRRRTVALCSPLETEDYVIQPMPDASPPKWHLAHVSWFFETFILKPYVPGYKVFNSAYEVLFNSYYNGVGTPFPRAERGRLSRPTVAEVLAYRRYIDDNMVALIETELSDELLFRTILGLNHEQQHQELLLTDLKYNLGNNPLYPAYSPAVTRQSGPIAAASVFNEIARGLYEIGRADRNRGEFAFDNESPRHEVVLGDVSIASRPVTNREFLAFMKDGGYRRPELWLSDAWSLVNNPAGGLGKPLYWVEQDHDWYEYRLCGGLQPLELEAPVCHVSGYEADAYARWANSRLPTEAELEVVAQAEPLDGNFVESGALHPVAAAAGTGLRQIFGDVWEWTSSSYGPYPGFRAFDGQLGEYNGKFMANQLVLRGGSCVTATTHMRPTYRNFFYPPDRWQFSGIRLARD